MRLDIAAISTRSGVGVGVVTGRRYNSYASISFVFNCVAALSSRVVSHQRQFGQDTALYLVLGTCALCVAPYLCDAPPTAGSVRVSVLDQIVGPLRQGLLGDCHACL